jgi:hypothetical protein
MDSARWGGILQSQFSRPSMNATLPERVSFGGVPA